MKKYLFLFALIIIYMVIKTGEQSSPVMSYFDETNIGVSTIVVNFNNGINSKKLINVFDKYNKEYHVGNIKVNYKNYKVGCNNMKKCIDEVYDQSDKLFDTNYIVNGFKVKEVIFISYAEDILPFLEYNNFEYIIK